MFAPDEQLKPTPGGITMFTTKTLSAAIAVVATVSLNAYAAQRQDNPLHPAYYPLRSSAPAGVIGGATYIDAGNPLHPAFAKAAVNGKWIVTGAAGSAPYVDSHNPRHPAFGRF
jgi:hypothetical protein